MFTTSTTVAASNQHIASFGYETLRVPGMLATFVREEVVDLNALAPPVVTLPARKVRVRKSATTD